MSELTRLAQNIKKRRQLMKLTQSELAQRLFVTAQNISKWETGKSVPDLENLCKLADFFSVSADRLLGRLDSTPEGRLLIAIDGGGTKTEFVLFTEYGEILERILLGSSNPNAVGMDATQKLLKTGLDQLLSTPGEISGVYAGISGCGLASNQKQLYAFLKKSYPGIPFTVNTDILNVIYSSPSQERCIAVICGTGSVVFAKTPEKMHQIGGWGYLWDSWCSGYTLGKAAIGAALSAREGTGPKTLLRKLVEEHLQGDVWEKVPELYRMSPDGIARFCPILFEAYQQGDAVSARILQENAAQLASWINNAAANHDCGNLVVLAGGITSQRTLWEPLLSIKLDPGLELFFSTMPQICGAAVGARKMIGNLSPDFRDIFYNNYQNLMEDHNHAQN